MNAEEKPVGYGNPPEHSRWKHGQSGNPSGRPKRTVRLNHVLRDVVNSPITIKENGCDREVTKLEAALQALMVRAIRGDTKASHLLLKLWIDAEQEAVGEDNEHEAKLNHALLATAAKLRKKENDALRQKPPCPACDTYIEQHLKAQPKEHPVNLTGYNGHAPGYLAELQAASDKGPSSEELWAEISVLEREIIKWHTDDDCASDSDTGASG